MEDNDLLVTAVLSRWRLTVKSIEAGFDRSFPIGTSGTRPPRHRWGTRIHPFGAMAAGGKTAIHSELPVSLVRNFPRSGRHHRPTLTRIDEIAHRM